MKIAHDPAVWRGMTRAELDRAYNNTAAVAGSARYLADWSARSAALRDANPRDLDIRYGPRERNRIDLFRSGKEDAPLLVFMHGGYWQRNSKEMFACMAGGPLARGMDVALLGYTLAPEARLTDIVGEVRAAIRFLSREASSMGIARSRLVVSGWSAGGHLTAMAMTLPEVDAGLAISGVFDLEPCRLNYLNDQLRLDTAETHAMSPHRNLPRTAGRLVCTYGTRELPELQRQSVDFADKWEAAGLAGDIVPLADHDHFSILEELASPHGRLAALAAELARR